MNKFCLNKCTPIGGIHQTIAFFLLKPIPIVQVILQQNYLQLSIYVLQLLKYSKHGIGLGICYQRSTILNDKKSVLQKNTLFEIIFVKNSFFFHLSMLIMKHLIKLLTLIPKNKHIEFIIIIVLFIYLVRSTPYSMRLSLNLFIDIR